MREKRTERERERGKVRERERERASAATHSSLTPGSKFTGSQADFLGLDAALMTGLGAWDTGSTGDLQVLVDEPRSDSHPAQVGKKNSASDLSACIYKNLQPWDCSKYISLTKSDSPSVDKRPQ